MRTRFAGAALSALLLVAAGALWWASRPRSPEGTAPTAILAFEKEDVRAFRVIRPEDTLAFERVDGTWRTVGERWRPSSSMVRRVAHQLHDLTARALVAEQPEDPERYGLGDDAIRVELDLEGGRTLAFAVGDPNPSSVSWYVRPLPDGAVYVVKKAAVDYYRLDASRFREDRIAVFDAADCTAVEVSVGGVEIAVRRVSEDRWQMDRPHTWEADRDRVRRVMGAVAAARALDFVADQPEDLEAWGLGESADRVEISVGSGPPILLRFGASIPDTDPPQRFAWHAGDDAVYAVRAAVFDPMTEPVEGWRNRRVVGLHGSGLSGLVVRRNGQVVAIERSADGWRWADGAPIPGATPRRVAEAAAGLRAVRWLDDAEAPDPWAVVELQGGAEPVTLTLGTGFDEPGPDGPIRRHHVLRDGPVAVVDRDLADRIDDLFREHGRKAERDVERHR